MGIFRRHPRISTAVIVVAMLWLFTSFWSFFGGEHDSRSEWHSDTGLSR
jgi:hypothetical protein